MIGITDVEPVGGAVAPFVAGLQCTKRQPTGGPLLDLRPDRITGRLGIVLVPSTLVADERRRLERKNVEVPSERDAVQTALRLSIEHEGLQIVGVEVAMAHAHRLESLRSHRQERRRVVIRVKQGNFAADQLCLGMGTPQASKPGHLLAHCSQDVRPARGHPVRVA